MVTRLAAEETRRKEIEDKYRFMTEKSESEKEAKKRKTEQKDGDAFGGELRSVSQQEKMDEDVFD